jgi:uncharacterized protein DUF930
MDEITTDRMDERPAGPEPRGLMLRWGLPASLAAHLIVGAFLLVTLPVPTHNAPDEPVVNVDIVDPPQDEAAPEDQAAAEEQAAPDVTLEEPEQVPSEEEKAAEEAQKAEEEKAAEEAQKAEAEEPKAPEPEAPEVQEPEPEKPAVEEPQPEPEPEQAEQQEPQPEEPAVEEQAQEGPAPQPESSASEREGQSKLGSFDVVDEYGDEDSRPRVALDGNSATDGGLVEDAPAEITSPFNELTADVPTPSARPEDGPRISVVPDAELHEAKQLFSTQETGSSAATRAIANTPRDERGANLCATELREQLRNATPAYWPELLPSYPLGEGTVMEVRDGAFRARGQWYDLAFRCEVDPDVRRVVSFALDVGDPIPRNEWLARGFPAF